MDRDVIPELYFDWMRDMVYDPNFMKNRNEYRKLLKHLNHKIFVYKNSMDANREGDGIDMRYARFASEKEIESYRIDKIFDPNHCSILEMMIALAIRCEENFMQNPDRGSRISKWFWKMIKNLGLYEMDDEHYNEKMVEDILVRFQNQEYEPDGKGGLFYIPDCGTDLRKVEIWCQLCWFLDYYLSK